MLRQIKKGGDNAGSQKTSDTKNGIIRSALYEVGALEKYEFDRAWKLLVLFPSLITFMLFNKLPL